MKDRHGTQMDGNSVSCSVCNKAFKTSHAMENHVGDKHTLWRKRDRKRKISNVIETNFHVSEVNGGHVLSLVMDRNEFLNQQATETSANIKPTESLKKQRVSSLLATLEQKAENGRVRFVIDVDNVGTIDGFLEFFEEYDVHLSFYVKNQLSHSYSTGSTVPFEISIVEVDDDDDLAALVEAKNYDCFIIACDRYRTYTNSGLVSKEWMEKHRVSCTYTKKFVNGKTRTFIRPCIPLSALNLLE